MLLVVSVEKSNDIEGMFVKIWRTFCAKKYPCSQEQGFLGTQKKGGGRVSVFLFFSFGGASSCENRSFLMFRKGIRVSRTNGTWGISLWEVGVLTQVSQFRRFEQEGKASEKICALENLCCFLGNIII